MTKDKMVGWHHQLNGREFEQTLGDSEEQGSLACCRPCGRKESDTIQRLNNKYVYVCGGCLLAKSCPTLSNPTDCSPPGSSDGGIFQARIQEWVAISFSNIYIYVFPPPIYMYSFFNHIFRQFERKNPYKTLTSNYLNCPCLVCWGWHVCEEASLTSHGTFPVCLCPNFPFVIRTTIALE